MVDWKRVAVSFAAPASVVLALACAARAEAAETIEQALREADFIVDWRLRYEGVDQAGISDSASAVTSRLRAGLQTAPYKHTSLQVEGVWLEDVVDDYDSTVNGQTQYPVVADPAGFAAINRLALINESLPSTKLTLGRQRIVLDDSRFVGNVGWRQHEQTFDGLRAQIGTAFAADLTYAAQVNRVFGPDSPQGKWEGDVVLANVTRRTPAGALTLFDYYVDIDGVAAVGTNTLGARLVGTKPLGSLTGSYALSYARQTDAGDNPASYDEHYYWLEGGLGFEKASVALGYEVLGGDGTNAFATPLATLHVFQGWADKFLTTPAAGIEDRYLKIAYPFAARGPFTRIDAVAFFHDFKADAGSARYGQELDVQLVARAERVVLTLKYADYRAGASFTDTDKLWVSVDYAF